MAIKVESVGINECIGKVNEAVIQLGEAAATIDKAMTALGDYWQGAAFDNAMGTYQDQYQTLLTATVPEAVESFRDYINDCMVKITDLDAQLAGN